MDIYIPRYELTISFIPAAYVVYISILYVVFFLMILFRMKLVYDTVYTLRYLKDKNGFFFKANDFKAKVLKIGNDHNAGLSYIYLM